MAEVGEVKLIGGDVFEAGESLFDRLSDHVIFEFCERGFNGFRIFQAAGVAEINKATMPFGEEAFDLEVGVLVLVEVTGG
ncbi:MAG: hypothetical protein BJG00_003775 [Limnothrix sp. CACIAM 69d]|nr:MAG: hypothetical protein BJG00_003775 [Limnothrix sp. CACIAM 69d]